MTKHVRTPSRQSMAGDKRLAKIRALRGGVEAMRKARTTYLPKEPNETDEAYIDRLSRSWLFPGLDLAIEDVADRVFSREVQMGEDMPAPLVDLAENVTAEGRNLNTFAKDVFEDGAEAGISFILVDAPRIVGPLTRAEETRRRLRPYFVHIRAEQILGWKTERRGAEVVLTQVRILEWADVPNAENPFEDVEIEQVRVLTLEAVRVRVDVWRKVEGKTEDWAQVPELSDITMDIDEIPLVAFYTKRTGFFRADPPYEKLADLNIAHWQSASDQRNILHFARVPVMVFLGWKKDGLTVGANRAFVTDNPDADVKVVEHSGAAIESGRADLKDIEERMQIMGLQLLISKPGNPTATGQAIDAAKGQTPLQMMALSLKDALEKAFHLASKFLGRTDAGSVEVNTDYGLSLMGGADLTFLLNAVNTGQISRETFLKECIRRNVLMDDLDPEEEIERIEDEMPEPVVLPDMAEEDGEDPEPAEA